MGRQRHHRTDPAPAALPPAFRQRMERQLGGEWPSLERALNAPTPTSVRYNPAKLKDHPGTPVPWCATGRYLSERPIFTLDPLLHAGAIYVQEAASMLLEQAVLASGAMDRPLTALDLCAAPGGKTTHLRSLLHPEALLVANEMVAQRRPVLCENVWKWGLPNVVVTGSPAEDFAALPGFFDLVLVDAPCSGEGMFRKDAFARAQWTSGLVEQCARMQREILAHAWTCLAPGGTLIYSTCTWSPDEDEAQLQPLLRAGAVPLPLPIDPAWGPVAVDGSTGAAWRAYPHRVQGEGFFLAALRKPGERPSAPPARRHAPTSLPPGAAAWSRVHELHLTTVNDTGHVVHGHHAERLRELSTAVQVVAPGTPMTVIKGGTVRPHPAWALSMDMDPSAFRQVDVDKAQALAYLRGETLRSADAHGTALLMHAGMPIGWLHGAGNRWNNPWPHPWRIRMRGQ